MTAVPRRPHRLRTRPALRALRRESHLGSDHLIQPLFVVEHPRDARSAEGPPWEIRLTVDDLVPTARRLRDAGIPAILLFGIPARKDPEGAGAADLDGIVPRAVAAVRSAVPELAVITDLCLCAWTEHGHCGVIRRGHLDHEATLPLLGRVAVAHARAGADLVAPSGMIDGAVHAIRMALDADGLADTGTLSYTAKYASALYAPFRAAAKSAPGFGDRRVPQLDPANAREALLEATLDVEEGADILMVKPATLGLDIVAALRRTHPEFPVAAFHVSGECSAVEAASRLGWLDRRAVVLETLRAIRRAGADMVITWYAEAAAQWLVEESGWREA